MSSTTFRIPAFLAAAVLAFPTVAQVKDYRDIKYPELPEFKIPSPEVYTTENGLTVFLMEDHELPLISVNAMIRTGADYDPADKVGLAQIVGQALREGGTKSMTGDAIDDYLGARAAFVETGMSGDSGSAGMNCLADDFDDVFAVFVDVLREPVFAEDKIELAKQQMKTSISRRNDDVRGITGREFRRLIYGLDSPLSRMPEYATVAAISREDLIAFHEKYYHPNNVYLGVVGDFDSAAMKKKIEAAFGDWPRGPAFEPPAVPYAPAAPGVYFIEKSDVAQANVRLGHLGIEFGDPDYFAVNVLNEVMSGQSGRFFKSIRTQQGLAYSVWGRVGADFERPGVCQMGLSTKSESMATSVAALEAETKGVIANPPTDEEIRRAKEGILNSFVFRYDSSSLILRQQMTYHYYGLPGFLESYRANIEKVTRDDVARAAKTRIHPDDTILLVVGKAEDFDKPVSTFGEVHALDISIPPPPDTTPAVVRTAAALEAGAAALARAAGALTDGGGMHSVSRDFTVALSMGGQSITVGQTVEIELPDKIRQVIKTPMGEQTIVIRGDQGFMSAAGQQRPLPSAAVEEAVHDLDHDLIVLLHSLDEPSLEAVSAGTEDVDGVTCDVVAVSLRGTESRLWIDPDGRVVKQSYQGKHPLQGTPGLIELHFSDYRDAAGILAPHKQVMTFEGQPLATVTLDSLSLNPQLDAQIFEMPGSD